MSYYVTLSTVTLLMSSRTKIQNMSKVSCFGLVLFLKDKRLQYFCLSILNTQREKFPSLTLQTISNRFSASPATGFWIVKGA